LARDWLRPCAQRAGVIVAAGEHYPPVGSGTV
jgi:hypothetical protein